MTHYLKDGEIYWPNEDGTYNIKDRLPAGTYIVGLNPKRGFYLQPINDFTVEGKIYGNTERRAHRILNTFHSRPNTTGVLLAGEKGSGKTLLAKLISCQAAEQDMPTLVINTPFTGDGFNTFVQNINQPCVIVFDEFEKVFDNDEQEQILTLLDGMFPTKKLFILTVNDKYRVNTHMRNRPGRIFYMLEFKGLEAEFIREYCEDNLVNKHYIDQICRLTHLFDSFNFDMLKALVEEMNRYNESPSQALDMLNAKPYEAGSNRHQLRVTYKGKQIHEDDTYPSVLRGNPIAMENIEVHVTVPTGVDDDGDTITKGLHLELGQQDIVKLDIEAGEYIYVLNKETDHEIVVSLHREDISRKTRNWVDLV